MAPIISVANLSKTYASGFQALKGINLEIRDSEIFALLGPNGAGKTTLIGIICGIVNPSEGAVSVAGHDIIASYRAARSMIALVPGLATDAFEACGRRSHQPGPVRQEGQPRPHREVLRSCPCGTRRTARSLRFQA
jgi:ABC-type polar amino acid transport system ATPase subunit